MSLDHLHFPLLLLSVLSITILTLAATLAPAQAPSSAKVALPPSPPPPLPPSPSKTRKHDIIQILQKEGDFTVLLQINSQPNDPNDTYGKLESATL
ncbi:hypothetical protein CDL15_Pgr000600 [Punica granatum]|uniref:Uncharacterized protein n=1 Tax=Punica granatum TaxID=22663 RepID=A0A218W3V6_PUNGR|nr:hypothetical protein CDL15_Pgr000600 [Punica granatum]PKI18246.1 hypothetical protein CRG98_049480 [Punica granatum]